MFQKILFRWKNSSNKIMMMILMALTLLGSNSLESRAAEIASEGPAILYVDSASVSLYNGPGEEYTPVSSVAFGTELTVDAMADNAWYRVSTDSDELWVNGAECSLFDPLSLPGGARIILGEGVDAAQAEALRQEYDRMPASCQALFSGITFYLDQSRIWENYNGSVSLNSIAGMYQYGKEIDLVPGNLSHSVIHECGHHIDYVLGKQAGIKVTEGTYTGAYLYSHSNGFQAVFNLECASSGLLDSHPTKDPAEYFAQAFKLYIQEPAKLRNIAPATHAYMESLIASLG